MGTVPGKGTGRSAAGVSIADVARRTGIPASTLRFYERELPGLFWIRKTAGGHRRYSVEDIERFTAIRRLTENEAIPLSEVRRVLTSRGDRDSLAEAVERLRALQQETAWTLEELGRRVSALEARIQELTASPAGRRRWFGKR